MRGTSSPVSVPKAVRESRHRRLAALSWYFDDETTPATEALLDQVTDAGAVVPSLWRLEVANALQAAIRRKRIDAAYRDAASAALAALAIVVDGQTDEHA